MEALFGVAVGDVATGADGEADALGRRFVLAVRAKEVRAVPVAAEPRIGPGLPKLQVATPGWR